MRILKCSSLLIWSLYTSNVLAVAEDKEEDLKSPSSSPSLNVSIHATFPQSEIFGVKLINGRPTQSLLSVTNNEAAPITVAMVGGSLWSIDVTGTPYIVRNLTSVRYSVEIPAGQKESLSYAFTTDLQPADLRLHLGAAVSDGKGNVFDVQAFNETVAVVEPETSIFDPQIIFLYLILLAAFLGTAYFIYRTWLTTLFPQKRRGGKGGERAKMSSRGTKKVDPNDQVAVLGADGPAVTSSSKAYDESWIPAHHINRPEARRLKSGGGSGGSSVKSKARKTD